MSVLTEGNSSRLHRLLVEEKELAIEVGGYFAEGFDPGLTWLQLTLPQGAKVAEVEKVLDAALDAGRGAGRHRGGTGASQESLRLVVLEADRHHQRQGEPVGQFDVFEGDYKKLFDSPATYDKVTREDVQKAAALVFQKNRRTVGVLEAKP